MKRMTTRWIRRSHDLGLDSATLVCEQQVPGDKIKMAAARLARRRVYKQLARQLGGAQIVILFISILSSLHMSQARHSDGSSGGEPFNSGSNRTGVSLRSASSLAQAEDISRSLYETQLADLDRRSSSNCSSGRSPTTSTGRFWSMC